MSKCCGGSDSKFFGNKSAGVCDVCNPSQVSPADDICVCPPIGEPRCLNMLAPVVFDESGINLCRIIDARHLIDVCNNQDGCIPSTDYLFGNLTPKDIKKADNIQLQVVDIDFNFVCPDKSRYSTIKPTKDKPNCSRLSLKDIDVTLAVKILDDKCKVRKEGFMVLRYLPAEDSCGFDIETNPSSVGFDLYTPYGISYAPENPCGCNKLVPTINYVGFVENLNRHKFECNCSGGPDCPASTACPCVEYGANNSVRQGISAQALAKVISKDDGVLAIGLTLYFKVIYLVQYKVPHAGLIVPPKFEAMGSREQNDCLLFVEGDLLEQSIRPLEVGVNSKTIKYPNREPCVNTSRVQSDTHGCGCPDGRCSCGR
ncbi:MAG: hypothetical protein GX366_05005 [Epulopiscium sp.]|nr:hypothetical protein [Candidatus Epulonipiscium sp.]